MGLTFDGVDSLIVDQNVVLFGPTSMLPPAAGQAVSSNVIDVSTYQHVAFQFQRNSNPTVLLDTDAYLEFRWSYGNGLNFVSERMSLSGRILNVADGTYTVMTPVRGMYMQIVYYPGAVGVNGFDAAVCIGSYRPCPPQTQKGHVIAGSSGSIPAATTLAFQMNFPYRGSCKVIMAGGAAGALNAYIAQDIFSGQGFGAFLGSAVLAIGQDFDANVNAAVLSTALPWYFGRITLQNTTAAPFNYYFAVIAD